ncbi:hypothetical protein IIV31_187R [Armadillidium vulgare iridescent virus]|uniref:Uncharacterized protein n=1 Tax=Armadillidium vulgare iridescent virus TaxID=72201 RepID=A0A068QLR9_9VIRU|nr:hypothetical protein IIV31_187R [Armadillidium vulgare iridescent virus]CCV02559.1 hypothetical protein IIV31_187R [Armadillidium vulgare iridescent virus]
MNRSDKIALDQIKKLVPINGDLINFAADVKVVAATDRPFLMAVVSQDQLETTTELSYKSIEKQVALTVRNDNNQYQPYVLVLKSDFPQEAIVTINLQETPLTNAGGCGRQTTIYPPSSLPVSGDVMSNGGPVVVSSAVVDVPWYQDWRYWLGIALIVGLILYFYMKNKKKEEPTIIEMSRYTSNMA